MVDMRSLSLAAAVGVTPLATAGSATAGFEGPYVLDNWSSSGIEEGTTLMSPGVAAEFSYDVNRTSPCEDPPPLQTARFGVPAAGDGTVSFDWTWSGSHDFSPFGVLEAYADSPTGLTVIELYAGPVGDSFSLSGSASIDVTAGYDFGIIVGGECKGLMEGTVRITNLVAPAAGFTANYSTDHWTTAGIPDGTTSILPECDTGARFSYDVDLGLRGDGVPLQTATFSVPATVTGTVSFDWQWTGFHAWFLATGVLQFFAESPSGTTVIDLHNGPVSGDFSFNGIASIDVEAGYDFGIIVGGSNVDSTSLLNGTVRITTFVARRPGFNGSNNIVNWESTGIVDGTTAMGPDLTTPSELAEFSYDVDLGFMKTVGVSPRTATFSVPAAEDGTITFDWAWIGFHAWNNAHAVLQVFGDGPSGATVIDLHDDAVNGVFSLCGNASIDVEAGYDFGIIVGGSNEDVANVINGTLRISNLAIVCAADVNGDGEVSTIDFLALLGAWGPNPGHPADLDGDGMVGVTDFLALLGNWGPCS